MKKTSLLTLQLFGLTSQSQLQGVSQSGPPPSILSSEPARRRVEEQVAGATRGRCDLRLTTSDLDIYCS